MKRQTDTERLAALDAKKQAMMTKIARADLMAHDAGFVRVDRAIKALSSVLAEDVGGGDSWESVNGIHTFLCDLQAYRVRVRARIQDGA